MVIHAMHVYRCLQQDEQRQRQWFQCSGHCIHCICLGLCMNEWANENAMNYKELQMALNENRQSHIYSQKGELCKLTRMFQHHLSTIIIRVDTLYCGGVILFVLWQQEEIFISFSLTVFLLPSLLLLSVNVR